MTENGDAATEALGIEEASNKAIVREAFDILSTSWTPPQKSSGRLTTSSTTPTLHRAAVACSTWSKACHRTSTRELIMAEGDMVMVCGRLAGQGWSAACVAVEPARICDDRRVLHRPPG
jgi:hypothetical protein